MSSTDGRKTNQELRKFGFVMAGAFAVVGGLLFWKEKEAFPYFLALAGLFLVTGGLVPRVLGPVEWAWMKMAVFIGAIVTRILLTLTFYLAITPMGLIMRLMGKDSLMIKKDPSRTSYWIPVEPDGPHSRPEKPY